MDFIKDINYITSQVVAADLWGQLAEEASELAQAALKMQRVTMKRNPPRKTPTECMANVIEECADVRLCLDLMGVRYRDQQEEIMRAKIARWAGVLRSNQKEAATGGRNDKR